MGYSPPLYLSPYYFLIARGTSAGVDSDKGGRASGGRLRYNSSEGIVCEKEEKEDIGMNQASEAPGQIVKAAYKTGEYVAEVMESDGRRALVKVLAVLRHPTQGDLHHPYDPDVPLFHERKASADGEKVWVPLRDLQTYSGEIPSYRDSLLAALEAEAEQADRLRRWAEKSRDCLETLRGEYRL
jgi:kinase-associated protein B